MVLFGTHDLWWKIMFGNYLFIQLPVLPGFEFNFVLFSDVFFAPLWPVVAERFFLSITLHPHHIFRSESTIDTNQVHLSHIHWLNSHQDWIVTWINFHHYRKDSKQRKARKNCCPWGSNLRPCAVQVTLQSWVLLAWSAPWWSSCLVGSPWGGRHSSWLGVEPSLSRVFPSKQYRPHC